MPDAPAWMRRNARRGLDWYEQGFGGDGLTDKTLQEARDMARGAVSEDKARRMAAWFARHMVDLEGTGRDTDPPTPGMVAHALWGGWPASESRRAQRWAEAQTKGDDMHNIQRRYAPAQWEVREAADGTVGVSGYAAVFDSESHGEVVRRTAFNKTLADGADVVFVVNHGAGNGIPLARTKSGTLRLGVDQVGLRMEVDALDLENPTARELVSAVKRGDLDQMSFAFWPVLESYTERGVRELQEVALVDVSAVTHPWYDATSIGLKSDDRELVEARDILDPGAEPVEPEDDMEVEDPAEDEADDAAESADIEALLAAVESLITALSAYLADASEDEPMIAGELRSLLTDRLESLQSFEAEVRAALAPVVETAIARPLHRDILIETLRRKVS
jgi:HK97 family phage prohead protease